MKKSAPLKIAITSIVLGFAVLMPAQAQDKKEKPVAEPKVDAAPATEKKADVAEGEEEEESKGLQIDKLLPLNQPNLRVKIPGFDKGTLSTMIEAAKLTRVDESNLKLEDALIQMVKEDVTIKLRSALYNTDVAVLSSNEKTTVSSPQFTIIGQTMDYDTKTGKGQMIGPNRTLIHNVGAMEGEKTKANEKAKPAATTTKEETKK